MLEVTEPDTVLVCAEKLETRGSTFESSDAQQVARLMQRFARGDPDPAPVEWVRVGWRLPTEEERPKVEAYEAELREKPEPKEEKRPSRIGQWLQSMTLIEWIIILTIFGIILAVIVR
jgi:hypothetical protein